MKEQTYRQQIIQALKNKDLTALEKITGNRVYIASFLDGLKFTSSKTDTDERIPVIVDGEFKDFLQSLKATSDF